MVVPSLHCVNTFDTPISNGGLAHQAAIDQRHLVISSTDQERRCKAAVTDETSIIKEATTERRFSARIQDKLKNRNAQDNKKSSDHVEDRSIRKKRKVYNTRKGNLSNAAEDVVEHTNPVVSPLRLVNKAVVPGDVEAGESNNLGAQQIANNVVVNGNAPANAVRKSDHAKAKEALRTFNKHYLHFVQEEEKRAQKVEASHPRTVKGKKITRRDAQEDDKKRAHKRPDLKAVSKMMETNAILFPRKRFGPIPGIEVGHQFYSRAEMVVVGLHSHWMSGIDYMGNSYSKGEYSEYTFPLAVAIVLSGQYEDDLDNSDDVVYTGQGGNNICGDKRQIRDQVMERGNLALKNCIKHSVPVRVVRGHDSTSSYCGRVYTYDGLYKVVQYWAEKGVSGFTVFKYRLRRLEGQPILTTHQVQFSKGRPPTSLSEIRGLACEDITGGQENLPIPATNLVDDPPVAPTGYTYCNSIQVSKSVKLPSNAGGCDCRGTCINPRTCSCAQLNGADFPYVHRDGGRLIEAKAIVFECGPQCGCGPECINRTSQQGMKYRLEVFRTPKKGWAVRSWDFIPSGAPICEYTGILMRTDEIDGAAGNNYIFDIDCLQTMKGLDGRERRLRDVSIPISSHTDKPDDHKPESVPEFCIDAGLTGNVARFINHSCEPNLFVQCVLSTHHDIKLARVMLFAADNIPPLQELTYDYGYALDSVLGPDGKIKKMHCYCGAAGCRKRLF